MPGDTSIFKKLNITVYNTILTVLFFVGLILTICEIDIYRDTFIDYIIPSLIWLLPGLLFTPFLANFLKEHINAYSLLMQLTYNICTWGGLIVYTFMALNFYLANSEISTVQLPIESTSYMAKGSHGCGNPVATITYNGKEKDLVFPCDVPIEKYNAVELKTQTGLWGYDVIKSKKLYKR